MQEAPQRRITGEFLKQVWMGRNNDEAMTIGTVKFDATRAVLARDLEFIHEIRDNDYGSDEIGIECFAWDGPHEVYVVESIVDFFGLGKEEDPEKLIEQITQDMLDQARLGLGIVDPDKIRLQLNMEVSYRLNGQSAEAIKETLRRLVERHIGDGMLTGETSVEVDEYSMDVRVMPDESLIFEETHHEA